MVPQEARAALAQAFGAALLERDPLATTDQREQAREKAFRSPLLMLAIVRLHDAADGDAHGAASAGGITPSERYVSAGCAIQNMLLMATALVLAKAGDARLQCVVSEESAPEVGQQAWFACPVEKTLVFDAVTTDRIGGGE